MKKWKLDPQVRSLSSSGPRMLALIALPLIKKFGEEAKQVISNIMYQDGLMKGKRLALKAKDRNDLIEFERLNVEEYEKQGTNTPSFDDPARKWLIRSKHICSYNLSLAGGCEMMIPQVWKGMGLNDKEIELLGGYLVCLMIKVSEKALIPK